MPRKPGFGRQHVDQRQPHCRHELSLEIASKGLTTSIQMKKEDARTKKRCCARGSLCCALQRLERVWATLGHLWLWPACWHQHRYVRAALHPGWEGRARQLARKKPSGYLALCWAEVEGLPAVPRLWRYPYMLSHLPGRRHMGDCGSGFE